MAISSVVSIRRGFTEESLSLAVWAFAFIVALRFSGDLSPYLKPHIEHDTIRFAACFLLLLVGCIVVGSLFNHLVVQWVHKSPLSSVDRLLGFMFGVARGVVAAAAIVFLMQLTPLPDAPWWKTSKFVPQIQGFLKTMPPYLQKYKIG